MRKENFHSSNPKFRDGNIAGWVKQNKFQSCDILFESPKRKIGILQIIAFRDDRGSQKFAREDSTKTMGVNWGPINLFLPKPSDKHKANADLKVELRGNVLEVTFPLPTIAQELTKK